ncbi:Fe-S-cluster-containing hydrogenase (plasmid) [Tistrella bauzanensis]|uniref:Fe-S-cluster-containing hydrogenase n=1 Tax=Tistrella arctica TaxID=3133430 RepID=A0ABU9YNW1_9PROT
MRDHRSDDVTTIRARLAGRTGRDFWRGLDDLTETPALRRVVDPELLSRVAAASDIDRRSMLKLMGASLALAGLTGCKTEADETAMPYVTAPEFTTPGVPRYYATGIGFAGYLQPVVGKTHVGRPVKLEGNDRHPATGGATDPFMQAALLGLYDPDRSTVPRELGGPTTWQAVERAATARAAALDASGGAGFRLLTGAVSSPTLRRQIGAMMRRWPRARWHVLEPAAEDSRHAATQRAFGQPLDPDLRLDLAGMVVDLDDDILGPGPRQAVHGRRWSMRRLARQAGDGDAALYVAEASPTLTGLMADERLIAESARIGALTTALAASLGLPGIEAPALTAAERRWVAGAVAGIRSHRGRAVVCVGARQPVAIQALGLLINRHIGAIGTTLRLIRPVIAAPPDGAGSFATLARDMAAGRVGTLAIIGANPAYTAPADLGFVAAMEAVPVRIHAGLHVDETAALCHWHLPLEHDLETWSDGRAVDGTAGIVQPLVRPFHDVRSVHVVVAALQGGPTGTAGGGRTVVQDTWRAAWGPDFDQRWQDALLQGFVAGSAAPPVMPDGIAAADGLDAGNMSAVDDASGLHLELRPDPTIWDGRYAENAWLQETPKPHTKLTWGNVLMISPALAAERGIATGDGLRVETDDGAAVSGPAWVLPGQAARTVTATLGYGRSAPGRIADGLGYNAFRLRRHDRPWHVGRVEVTAEDVRHRLATTQRHQAMDGYDFVRTVPAPDAPPPKPEAVPEAVPPSLYPQPTGGSPSWGMSIDLDLCIGCNACVVACVAENNVPVVGRDLVAEGREMHWLRVDHYHEGAPEDPRMYVQPVPCMHCEQAPCEMGCPVNATVHSSDGLNLQVYNRCIGTRTCSSFCPYKVRRFNWFDYTGDDPEPVRAMRNPDVTVRDRGVMEKCTYCIQRISAARIEAKKDGRPIRDGEVVPACQQACPTRAIVFGDVTDPDTAVSRRKAGPRDYSLLEEAGTRPRTTYLARIEPSRAHAEDDRS